MEIREMSERDYKNALYKINTIIESEAFQVMTGSIAPEDSLLPRLIEWRDELWAVGQTRFGWKD